MSGEREVLAEEIAGVLADHRYRDVLGDYKAAPFYKHFGCSCGWEQDIAGMSGWRSWVAAHDRHLADLLAARDRRVRAEALREAADNWPREVNAENLSREMATNLRETPPEYRVDQWLRDRADRIEADQ